MAAKLPEIIGMVGPIRAGKTTVTKYLVEKYGYVSASNSDVLKRILDGMGILPTRDNLSALGDSIFKVLGNDIIAQYRIDNLHNGRIIVDGVRYPEELMRYSQVKSFKLLAVMADPDLRFERTLRSLEEFKDVDISRSRFDNLASARSELDVPVLMSKADVMINNSGDIESLKARVDEIVRQWTL